MIPREFDSARNSDAVSEFQWWLDANPGAFYVNLKTERRGVLHRVGCHHLGDPRDWRRDQGDPCKNAKICSPDRQALVGWADDREVELELCGDCLT